jgi:hypothetical protein
VGFISSSELMAMAAASQKNLDEPGVTHVI